MLDAVGRRRHRHRGISGSYGCVRQDAPFCCCAMRHGAFVSHAEGARGTADGVGAFADSAEMGGAEELGRGCLLLAPFESADHGRV